MPKIDWSKKGNKRGLAVEGEGDKSVVEGFLEAGERLSYWSNWRNVLVVEVAGKYDNVINESKEPDTWGLIDRDWRSDDEVIELQHENPQLLVLPRIMIENYLIVPDELIAMLPKEHKKILIEMLLMQTSIPNWTIGYNMVH